jgi:hypothetical protein
VLVDVQGLLHPYDHAISIWLTQAIHSRHPQPKLEKVATRTFASPHLDEFRSRRFRTASALASLLDHYSRHRQRPSARVSDNMSAGCHGTARLRFRRQIAVAQELTCPNEPRASEHDHSDFTRVSSIRLLGGRIT